MNEYNKQAQDFLEKTDTKFSAKFLQYDKYFPDDKEPRDIYEITLQRNGRKYTFRFGNSILNSGKFVIVYQGKKTASGTRLHTKQELGKYYGEFAGYGRFWEENKSFSEPTPYDVLAAVTKSHPGTFENFCSDFGYDTDSRKAEGIYKAVVNEYQNLAMLYNDAELELMAEIQ